MAYLTEDCKITIAITPTEGASASTDVEGATLDMAGWDGVLMVVSFGAITAGAATSIKAQQDSDSQLGTVEDITGSAQTVADNADDKTFYIDIRRPTKRYVRLHVDRATQVATVGSALYIQYKGRTKSSAQGTNVTGEQFFGVVGGTA